ncbi:MAG TPA: LUD domain-containing protein [Rhizomicrobium sp.]|jgi:L-lactate dehydrogenase complex protein LldG|nr:LUD domain-containing protein [Rhizomicrobium sp.]
MSSREQILSGIRARRIRRADRPASYVAPTPQGDPVQRFADEVRSEHAEVHMLDSEAGIPAAIADILRAKNLPASVHLPDGSAFAGLPWGSLTVEQSAPGPDDAALARADFAIAETGTLAYLAQTGAPASWHFRAGLEIAVIRADAILPHLENVLTRVRARLPHTLNLVTGPSRTGDIEQTLELGAHGPKALAILIVRS